jgi:glutathione S-transferase
MAAKEMGIDVSVQIVDLMTGEHHSEAYVKVNPNRLVPTLDDDGFLLTESSAILKYLAEKVNSPLYPKELKARARVNEAMDWFNTNFYRDYGYNLVYPQIYPHHKRPTDEINGGTVKWGLDKVLFSLGILNDHMLQDGYVAGPEMTIADIFGAQLISLGELLRFEFSKFKNVDAWLGKMRARPSWKEVNSAHDDFGKSLAAQAFVAF